MIEVADYMNMSKSNLFSIYKRNEIDNFKLAKFSELFGVNLFEYYLEKDAIKQIFSADFAAFESRITELEATLEYKDKELRDKDEIISMLKKVVALHEANDIRHK